MSSTIFALSSGSLPCAIAVFRVSGPKSLTVLRELSRKKVWKPREMKYTELYNQSGIIDQAMAVYFPGPKTFTGEDTAELFIHGSKAVAGTLAETLARLENVREAKRGEFTRRAFYNGKMDMNEVRGLDRLIWSRTEKERRMAFGQMRGGMKALEIRKKLKNVLAKLFVIMDFGEHVELQLDDAKADVEESIADVQKMIKSWKGAEIARRGLNIVLYGIPNSGKSSILNRLVHDDVAIVSSVAGTTRDSIDATVEIGGIICKVTDTAGIRSITDDHIELEGMRRARNKVIDADIVVIVVDPNTSQNELENILKDVKETANSETRILIVRNKNDLELSYPLIPKHFDVIDTTTKQFDGMEQLRKSLSGIVDEMCPETTFLLDASLLQKCCTELILATCSSDAAIICCHIETALEHIAELTTNTVSEDVLDDIFGKFCIGK